jgi:long-chain acyl-CoA synthetase
MADHPFISTPQRLIETARGHEFEPACYHRSANAWVPTSWDDLAGGVIALARSLLSGGVKPQDRVAILAYNRREWVMADLAIMMIGAVSVGIYFTAAPNEIEFILRDSGAVLLFLENADQCEKLHPVLQSIPTVTRIVTFDQAHSTATSWSDLLDQGRNLPDDERQSRLARIRPNDLGTLIYTSGTTGAPKAVGLSHGALSECLGVLGEIFHQTRTDRAISYLPLAHIAERMLSVHSFAANGFTLYFAQSVQDLASHLPEIRPTIFFGVPRVWEKLSAGLQQKLGQSTGVTRLIAAWAQKIGREWHRRARLSCPPGAFLRLQHQWASRLVYRKVKAAIGFDAARMLISGAAPIAPETLEFLTGLDLVVYELYGQSETCGPTTSNLPGANRLGSVGRAVPGTEIKIADDGEVLVRDRKLFTAYIGRPDATAETLIDGWLLSGDLGRIDPDGFLFITGRKKDLIITAGGKNIAPSGIEAELEALPLVEHGIVIGDRRPFLVAVVTLSHEALTSFAIAHNLAPDEAASSPLVRAEIQRGVDRINENQSRVAQIRRFAILNQNFSVETGELTPTLKLRRSIATARCATAIDQLYAER